MASTTNPLLKYIVGGVALVLVIALLKSGDDKKLRDDDKVIQTELQEFDIQDGDSTKDTISTLVAHVRTLKQDTEKLLAENKRLTNENRNIESTIKREVGIKSKEQLAIQRQEQQQAQQRQEQSKNSYLDSLSAKLDDLQNKLNAQGQSNLINTGDIPNGLGFDEGFPNATNGWVMPTDLPPLNDQGKYEFANTDSIFGNQEFGHLPDAKSVIEEIKAIPVYTVPENSTLLGSTAMTGLVGRIPVNGKITDPYPFKIIVGSDDLATNGHSIPGLSGMVFSGVATGDLMLQCVSAKLYSVTYTFDDGTIRTIREESGAGVDLENSSGTSRRGLGWLSDEWGNPCLKGELITNAPSYLASMITLAFAEGYGKAYAENETTTVVSDAGSAITSTTGDPYKKATGDGVANGIGEASDWLKARQKDSFDAIFVPSGTKVAVHIDTELQIDYEPNGRKLSYDGFAIQQGYTNSLD